MCARGRIRTDGDEIRRLAGIQLPHARLAVGVGFEPTASRLTDEPIATLASHNEWRGQSCTGFLRVMSPACSPTLRRRAHGPNRTAFSRVRAGRVTIYASRARARSP